MPELKPCPFCGGKAELIQTKCLTNGCVLYHVFHYDIKCSAGGIRTENSLTPEEATEAWNRRYEPRQELEFGYEAEA